MPGQALLAKWNQILAESAELATKLRLLIRVANHTNQVGVARMLLDPLRSASRCEIDVAILSKPEHGASEVRDTLQRSEIRVRSLVLEVPAYSDIGSEALTQVSSSDAILFVIPEAAPLFDETIEFVERQFSSVRERVLLVATPSDPETTTARQNSVVRELKEAGFTACASRDVVAGVLNIVLCSNSDSHLDEPRRMVRSAAQQLLPFANAFADFLSLNQARYLRRLEYVHRDLNALATLAQEAKSLLETNTRKCMGNTWSALQAVTLTMRQQAETAVQNTPIPREVLASLDARTQFGRAMIGTARVGGYREFDLRLETLAMDLNSARSVLLSKMEQIRVEAQTHLEELTLNLGPGLLPAWLASDGPSWAQNPMDFSFESGSDFADKVTAAARQVRAAVVEPQFTSAWASRMEALYKGEMAAASTANWMPGTLDQPLMAAISLVWKDTTERSCGILIGRLNMIVEAVTAGVGSGRPDSLQLPKDDDTRTEASRVFRSFVAQLIELS